MDDNGTGYRLQGKKVLITGASQGIGQAIALRLAKEGCDVVVNHRNSAAAAEETKQQILAMGRNAAAVQADISKKDDVVRLMDEAVKALGSIDCLVNNAGVEKHSAFLDVSEADYALVVATNMTGPFFLSQAFAQKLKDAGRPGKIVNISSVHEELPFPNFTPYCMAKGGLKMMMRNLSVELAALGITVNNIAPGAIETPINKSLLEDKHKLNALLENIPLRRLGQPSDVSGLCAFLLSPDSDYVTGATFFVDGGLTWNYSEQ